jgi:hypothetical protein
MPAHIFPLLSCFPANFIAPPTFTPPPPHPPIRQLRIF